MDPEVIHLKLLEIMSLKKVIEGIIEREGLEQGRIIILNTLANVEATASSLNEGDKNRSNQMRKLNVWLNEKGIATKETLQDESENFIKELNQSIVFNIMDPVKIKFDRNLFDPFLDYNEVYRVSDQDEDFLYIRDESGNINPYLKSRFINVSTHLKRAN